MLTHLNIENVVLIESLDLAFQRGLCALTGETGAGKSILLDSLGLALGFRAEAGLVRKGTARAVVSASFDVAPGHPVFARLQESGIDVEAPLILRRILGADGRSKAFINDQPVSITTLRAAGGLLVEIHGQFETQGLLDPATHRVLVDEYGGLGDRAADLAALWHEWARAEEELTRAREEAQELRREEDYLRHAVDELDTLAPQEGEEEELGALRQRLKNREALAETYREALAPLSGDKSAQDYVHTSLRTLERVADQGGEGLNTAISYLDQALNHLHDAEAALEDLMHALGDEDYASLEEVDERYFALKAQARKHQCVVDDLPALLEDMRTRLERIEHSDDYLAQKMREAGQARDSYVTAAGDLYTARARVGAELDSRIAAELPPLKLDKARFVTAVTRQEDEGKWGPNGMDQVRFLVATNPGSEPGPLNKVASGGEMARFMLALKVVLAETGAAGSMIFDEVDAGIGGATADAVGERLARLAAHKQLLVVTHSPQVAARAENHWIVAKDEGTGNDLPRTGIIVLEERDKRREEIARMLAGARVTDEARAAAAKLLEGQAA